MYRVQVKSSNLKSVGYDTETKTLEVEFQDGGLYQYLNVPAVVHRDLLNAPSHGKYFAYFIKNSYRFKKVAG